MAAYSDISLVKIQLQISAIQLLISTMPFFDINNSIVDIKKCHCWYQEFISWKWI